MQRALSAKGYTKVLIISIVTICFYFLPFFAKSSLKLFGIQHSIAGSRAPASLTSPSYLSKVTDPSPISQGRAREQADLINQYIVYWTISR